MTMRAGEGGFLADMRWRGLVHQTTGDDALSAHLASGTRRAYVGFDPTADSLTIGNLVGVLALVRFALAGHEPVVVMGGGTGLIGDPSGKSKERELNTLEVVEANVRSQRGIFEAVWAAAGLGPPPIVNNHDWLGKLSYLEALRDIGKHFSVNMMMQKESVKERLHNRDQGISYTEFSYMILQAYDFFHLWKVDGVTLQMGGSDQYGNIVAGIDLIRRMNSAIRDSIERENRLVTELVNLESQPDSPRRREVQTEIMDNLERRKAIVPHGLTWPLVTKADGGKFGKTESGAIWLTAERTSPYAFYQFWLNAADADVVRFLKTFTLLSHEEIGALGAAHEKNPGARGAHRALARHMTTLLHGAGEMEGAEAAARALFSGEIASLDERTLREALSSAPSSTHAKSLLAGGGVAVLDLLVDSKLAQSKREAREFLSGGSVIVNGRKAGIDDRVRTRDLLYGELLALRRGKKNWHLSVWK